MGDWTKGIIKSKHSGHCVIFCLFFVVTEMSPIYFNILVHKTIQKLHIYIQYKNVYRQLGIITCTLYALKTLYDIIQ